jgi:hypothetical protein
MQMADLSPEAQAVLAAVMDEIWGLKPEEAPRLASESKQYAAAALRAAAHQAIPETGKPNSGNAIADAFAYEAWNAKNITCLKLFAIADELEGANQ